MNRDSLQKRQQRIRFVSYYADFEKCYLSEACSLSMRSKVLEWREAKRCNASANYDACYGRIKFNTSNQKEPTKACMSVRNSFNDVYNEESNFCFNSGRVSPENPNSDPLVQNAA